MENERIETGLGKLVRYIEGSIHRGSVAYIFTVTLAGLKLKYHSLLTEDLVI